MRKMYTIHSVATCKMHISDEDGFRGLFSSDGYVSSRHCDKVKEKVSRNVR